MSTEGGSAQPKPDGYCLFHPSTGWNFEYFYTEVSDINCLDENLEYIKQDARDLQHMTPGIDPEKYELKPVWLSTKPLMNGNK